MQNKPTENEKLQSVNVCYMYQWHKASSTYNAC